MSDTTIGGLDSLGQVLKTRRNTLGWSLAAAAHRIGIATPTLGSYERGDRNPPVETLVRILNVYELRLAVVDDGELARRRIEALRAELQQLEAVTS